MASSRLIFVPVTDNAASFAALSFAGELSKARKATVYAVHVIEVLRSLPVDAEMEWEARTGEQLLHRAEIAARRENFRLERELLQSRNAGQAIVDEAHARQASLIVLGIEARKDAGDFEPGRTTAYVLKHARCEVLVMREAAKER